MTDDDEQLVTFRADGATYEKAKRKLDHGDMSEILRERLNEVAHGADVSERERTKDLLKEKRREKRETQQKIQNHQSTVDELNHEIERLEDKLDRLAEQDGQYDGILQSLDELLQDGKHVFIGHAQIRRAAEIGECSQEDVIQDLRERNPTIPDEKFEQGI